ncbi:MAG: diguanylate cyclase [Gemmataceae bacterium]|nr:diguanylate cyclase [Gemmataceae bacterium]MCS7270398.1 diguanylate cyclase [Gemmataceae bacterium]MDW8242450.1 diguanylate cyclase [Thermogemmata sp.]
MELVSRRSRQRGVVMNVTRHKSSVLVVDDDPHVLELLRVQLEGEFEVLLAETADQAREILASRSVDMVLTDLQLPGESGLSLLEWVRRTMPRTSRLLLTGTARLEDAIDAINQAQVHRLILKPWRREDLVQALQAVARNLVMERSHEQLLEQLRQLNQELERRVEERTQQLQAVLEELRKKNHFLEKVAITDPLTGLPNRRGLEMIIRKELLRRQRQPQPFALLLVDIDHFKQINSEYLHPGGDHVLVWLTGIMQQSIRGSDSLARIGGEEFLIVAPNTDLFGAEVLAERLRTRVADAETFYNGRPIHVTVSIGAAVADAETVVSYNELHELAAAALRQAKENGRNCSVIRYFQPPITV